jgi:hypothetical protein
MVLASHREKCHLLYEQFRAADADMDMRIQYWEEMVGLWDLVRGRVAGPIDLYPSIHPSVPSADQCR